MEHMEGTNAGTGACVPLDRSDSHANPCPSRLTRTQVRLHPRSSNPRSDGCDPVPEEQQQQGRRWNVHGVPVRQGHLLLARHA